MGSSSSSLRSSKLSARSVSSSFKSKSDRRVQLLQDQPFQEMAQNEHCPYHRILEMQAEYAIYIQRKDYHWFLLLRCTNYRHSETEQFVTLEVTTPDLRRFCPVMDVLQDDEGKELVGNYKATFLDLCRMADGVIEEMGNYSLFSNNCQHFCNNTLKQLKLKTFPTTFKSKDLATEEEKFDHLDYLASHKSSRIKSAFARVMNEMIGAPRAPPPSHDNEHIQYEL